MFTIADIRRVLSDPSFDDGDELVPLRGKLLISRGFQIIEEIDPLTGTMTKALGSNFGTEKSTKGVSK